MKDHTIQDHWDDWARRFGPGLRSTTKCHTIKRLELAALGQRIREALAGRDPAAERPVILEVGCGPLVNALPLLSDFPEALYLGADFSAAMINNGIENLRAQSAAVQEDLGPRLGIFAANVLELAPPLPPAAEPAWYGTELEARLPLSEVDLVFTDRCLINLPDARAQIAAAQKIQSVLAPGGAFLMLENSVQSHARLNLARRSLGLPERPPASFNVFIDEEVVLPAVAAWFELEAVDDFGGPHDLILYAVAPSLDPDREIVYDSDLMKAVTDAVMTLAEIAGWPGWPVGQNRLWCFRKRD